MRAKVMGSLDLRAAPPVARTREFATAAAAKLMLMASAPKVSGRCGGGAFLGFGPGQGLLDRLCEQFRASLGKDKVGQAS